jgi:ABC-type polysaccharide/polyol phosphate export permease
MTPELWSMILGLIMTLVTGFLVKQGWKTAVKALVAIAISMVFAVTQGLVLGTFTIGTITQNLVIIFASGEALYGLYFKEIFKSARGE